MFLAFMLIYYFSLCNKKNMIRGGDLAAAQDEVATAQTTYDAALASLNEINDDTDSTDQEKSDAQASVDAALTVLNTAKAKVVELENNQSTDTPEVVTTPSDTPEIVTTPSDTPTVTEPSSGTENDEFVRKFIDTECGVNQELFDKIKEEVTKCESRGSNITFIGGYSDTDVYAKF